MKATQITLVLLLAFLSYPCHSQFAPESLGDALSKEIVNRERLAWEAQKTKTKQDWPRFYPKISPRSQRTGCLTKRKFWPTWIT